MEFVAVFLIAVGLSMDAFAVSVCKGLAMGKPRVRSAVIIGLWFGIFQALMPVIGYLFGSFFYDFVSSYAHWVAFALLTLIGGNMIREALFEDEEEGVDADTGAATMLLLAIATSIDALAVGISFSMTGSDIFDATLLIGVVTTALSIVGVYVGSRFGDRYGPAAEIVGGIILIGIGLKLVLESCGFF